MGFFFLVCGIYYKSSLLHTLESVTLKRKVTLKRAENCREGFRILSQCRLCYKLNMHYREYEKFLPHQQNTIRVPQRDIIACNCISLFTMLCNMLHVHMAF